MHPRGRSCGVHYEPRKRPGGLRVILECKPLLVFTAAITLFHFANAAMLPLVGERLSQGHQNSGSLFIGACIITAQIVMVPMAVLVGAKRDVWGRKPLFLVGFAALPIRGLFYTLWDNPFYLICVQMLDGVGAGLFGALFALVVADLTKGHGHYNSAIGSAGAAWGAGAALSNSVAGFIVDKAGFDAAFLFLAGVDVLAYLLFWFAVPEIGQMNGSDDDKTASPNTLGLGGATSSSRTDAFRKDPQTMIQKEASPRAENEPTSRGSLRTALAATMIVAAGALALAGALILIAMLLPLATRVVQSIDLRPLASWITWGNGTALAAVLVFVATYMVIAIGKLPGYQLDRAGAALVGASLMVGLNVVSLKQAYRAIDFDAITLLLGMMIVVATLRLSGSFRLVNSLVVARARHPLVLLIAIFTIAGSFSAFLVNDSICLVMTPLVLDLVIPFPDQNDFRMYGNDVMDFTSVGSCSM